MAIVLKTHHYGIFAQIANSIIIGVQAYNGETVNLTDPTVWTYLTSVAMTIYGFKRNKPQQ